jgi:hypothetical protein
MPFEPYYNNLVNQFNDLGCFHEYHPDHGPIVWPRKRRGVYAVWKKSSSEKKELIYVGQVGYFKMVNQEFMVSGFIKEIQGGRHIVFVKTIKWTINISIISDISLLIRRINKVMPGSITMPMNSQFHILKFSFNASLLMLTT